MDVSTKFTDLTNEQQAFLLDFLGRNFTRTQTVNQRHSAYGMKQRFTAKYFYVTQEQFTEAMRRLGFKVELTKTGNAYFNISERSTYFKEFT